jgi:hypothetical protein
VETREDARVLGELLDELTPLQRRIIKLRWGCGLSRRETAGLLRISEKSVKREMEKAAPLIASNVELARAGRWCDTMRSLVVAHSLGLLGEKRAARARQHLLRCPSCRAVANAVRERMEGLGAVLPLPLLSATAPPQGILAHAAELGDSIRTDVTDLVTGAKLHALALFTRTPAADTAASQVAVGGGLKGGGAALAAVTACLAAGGGATYCAVEGVPESLRDLAPVERSGTDHARTDRREDPDRASLTDQPLPSAGVGHADPVESEPRSAGVKPELSTTAITTEGQALSAPTGSDEFGPGSAAPPQPATRPTRPARGGEFGP